MHEKHLTLLFLRRGEELLLAMKKRGHGVGKWNGVGGKVELDETIQQAAIRECEEEIGVHPYSLQPVGEQVFISQQSDGTEERSVAYVFFCTKWEGEPQETEEMAPQWFHEKDVPYDAMWADDQYWLPKLIAGEKVFGTYRFDEHNQLLEHTTTSVDILPHESDMRR